MIEDPPGVTDLLDKVGHVLTQFRSLDPTKEEMLEEIDRLLAQVRHKELLDESVRSQVLKRWAGPPTPELVGFGLVMTDKLIRSVSRLT